MGSNITTVDHADGVIEVLRSIDRGDLLLDLEQALSEVVQAIMDHGKKGEIIMKMTLTHDRETDTMKIMAEVKKKVPVKQKRGSLFFLTPHGTLTRDNPKQREMFDQNTGELIA
jgi:hypothetical protein